eukprot:4406149-Pyramimonas_sp.AAC.1
MGWSAAAAGGARGGPLRAGGLGRRARCRRTSGWTRFCPRSSQRRRSAATSAATAAPSPRCLAAPEAG